MTPQMVSSIRDGRASIKPTGEEDIYIPCDVLIVAIGQNIETHHFEQAGIPVERGKIITKSTGAFENLPGVLQKEKHVKESVISKQLKTA